MSFRLPSSRVPSCKASAPRGGQGPWSFIMAPHLLASHSVSAPFMLHSRVSKLSSLALNLAGPLQEATAKTCPAGRSSSSVAAAFLSVPSPLPFQRAPAPPPAGGTWTSLPANFSGFWNLHCGSLLVRLAVPGNEHSPEALSL